MGIHGRTVNINFTMISSSVDVSERAARAAAAANNAEMLHGPNRASL